MKYLALSCFAVAFTACSSEPEAETVDTSEDMDMATHDMSDHDMNSDMAAEVIETRGAGTVMAMDAETQFITLDHEAMPDIQMGAMRMPFDVAETIDLSPYDEGDAVIFDLEVSEETGLLITKLCRPATDGETCLDD